jgi:hypothetical protein
MAVQPRTHGGDEIMWRGVQSNEELYSELKPDIVALATLLFEISEKFVANRGHFLPHGGALKENGEVMLVAGAPPSDWTTATEVLPLVHDGLRASVRECPCTAVAVAESVTVTPTGQRPTTAIKVLFEHRRGLCVAMYLPFKKKVFGGYSFGQPFTVPAKPEVRPWEDSADA